MLTHGQRNKLKRIFLDQRGEILAAISRRPTEEQRAALERIDERLHAIRSGSFGLCRICGAPLQFAELQAAPWKSECGACYEEQPAAP